MGTSAIAFNVSMAIPGSTIVWSVFAVVVAIATIFSIIFLYHWRAYNITHARFGFLTMTAYLIGLGVLMLTMFLSALTYVT